jgi:Tfp pilus assembly protein PilO
MNLSKLATLTCRQIDLIGGAILLIAASGLFLPSVNPLLRSESFARQQQEQLSVALRSEKDLKAFLVDQRGRLAEINATLEKEKIQLESSRNINRRIASLTKLAAGAGLSVDQILPGVPTPGERFDRVPVRMNASGSYPTCVAFLCKLNETFPDTSVGSFELAGNPENPGSPAAFEVNLIWHAKAEYDRPPNSSHPPK